MLSISSIIILTTIVIFYFYFNFKKDSFKQDKVFCNYFQPQQKNIQKQETEFNNMHCKPLNLKTKTLYKPTKSKSKNRILNLKVNK